MKYLLCKQADLSSESLHLHKKPCMVVTDASAGEAGAGGFEASQSGQTSEFSERVSSKNKIGERLRKNPKSGCDIHSNMCIPTHIQTCMHMTKRWEGAGSSSAGLIACFVSMH